MLVSALLLAALPASPAATVHALVEITDSGVRLIDAVTHIGDERPAARPALSGAPPVVVRDRAGRILASASIPDPRLRSIVPDPAGGPHGDAVVLDRAVARVVLDWPAGAADVAVDAAPRVPRAAPPGEAVAVIESGDSAARLDMVFLGDGYAASELDRFAADVDRMAASMLSIEPYGAYADLFNVWRVDQASAESGVSHYDGGRSDPRDTAYGCFYGCGGIDRLVCCDDAAVMGEVAERVPGADGVMVLINDPTYGGSGGYQYATSYTDGRVGEQVVVHELGHSLVGLGDEYSYGASTSSPPRPNCTDDPAEPPWTAWLDVEGVSTTAVCGYTNHYRPTENGCMMRSLRDDYCVVCREQAVLSVYAALPSVLASVDPSPGPVTLGDAGQTFSATVLGDDPTRFEAVWLLDGRAVGDGLTLTLDGCDHGGTLELAVQDPSPWVRSDPRGLLVDGAVWSLDGCGETDGGDGADGSDGVADSDSGDADGGVVAGVEREPAPSGCGCAAGGGGVGWAWVLPLVGVVRRRRAETRAGLLR